jgi:hypothetical protein
MLLISIRFIWGARGHDFSLGYGAVLEFSL